ncbi:hypothetical protein, partial [Salmonella sp. s51228]|uniref:hypothetical protein n=1 Tax=Salmonella sp. s51228 TaxID=3159652 RepID=UPI00397FEA4D
FMNARREREKILEEYRKRVEEQKERVDKIEKRLQRSGTQLSDEMEPLLEQTENRDVSATQQQHLLSYVKAMEVIKDATAVSGIDDVVSRFSAQG